MRKGLLFAATVLRAHFWRPQEGKLHVRVDRSSQLLIFASPLYSYYYFDSRNFPTLRVVRGNFISVDRVYCSYEIFKYYFC